MKRPLFVRSLGALIGICSLLALSAGALSPASAQNADALEKFRSDLRMKLQALDTANAPAFAGTDGWLFISAELRLLSAGTFWGADAAKASHSPKPEWADPLPAILDFNKQLKDRGIYLLVVPVPPKAQIYPEKIAAGLTPPVGDPAPALAKFYDELRAGGVDVLDLAPAFRAAKAGEHGPVFCKTDTHWSGAGCVIAAQAIADKVRPRLALSAAASSAGAGAGYASDWKNISIDGDLGGMLGADAKKPGPETISIRQLKDTVAPDPNSPLLLLGDSHTLVFHDFLAERAGLMDQLAADLGIVPDRIGIRGSGSTPVRIDLYRRSLKEPGYLAKKKVVVWCFTAREFTEAAQGWQKLPVAK